MCFIIGEQKEYKIAIEDIAIYKLVEVIDSPKRFVTYWQKYPIPNTGILKSNSKKKFPWKEGIRRKRIITGNAIHSYSLDSNMGFRGSYCRGIIPKGALYYYNDDYNEYVSTELHIDLTSYKF
jgi:hypothetical protein